MNQRRTAGVLMHLTSLPGKYGTGVMGKEAKQFIDRLFAMDFHLWQVLPLNPVDMSGSPYCSVSAFAGNISLIDPQALFESGLITEEELHENEYDGSIYVTDYAFSYEKRLTTLRKAFSRITDDDRQLISIFLEQNSWVKDYAVFMALKAHHEDKPWWEWDEKFVRYEKAMKNVDFLKAEIDFYSFTQYVFYTQWRKLKE